VKGLVPWDSVLTWPILRGRALALDCLLSCRRLTVPFPPLFLVEQCAVPSGAPVVVLHPFRPVIFMELGLIHPELSLLRYLRNLSFFFHNPPSLTPLMFNLFLDCQSPWKTGFLFFCHLACSAFLSLISHQNLPPFVPYFDSTPYLISNSVYLLFLHLGPHRFFFG